jgi:PAS domain S-box-containing protein
MPDTVPPTSSQNEQALLSQVARLNKVVHALMDRAERSAIVQGSDFNMFQTTIMLEDQVRQRTRELEIALHHNQTMTCALRESEARFRGLVTQSLVRITVSEEGRFTYTNAKFAEMFGYTLEETLRMGPLDIAAEDSRQIVAEQVRRRLSGEVDRLAYLFRGLRKDRTVADVECHSSVMDIGGKIALISLLIDVTERLQAERRIRALQEQLREQAIRDPLTGLYNRHPLNEFFDRELSLAKRRGHSISAVMGDL